jgi:hypothetical protein
MDNAPQGDLVTSRLADLVEARAALPDLTSDRLVLLRRAFIAQTRGSAQSEGDRRTGPAASQD